MKFKELTDLLNKHNSINKTIKYICDEQIGSGAYRDVYSIRNNNRYVIKIERDYTNCNFANVTEWRNYIDAKDWKELSDYMAPIHLISQSGRISVQSRVKPVTEDYRYLPKIPSVFSDTKIENWGWLGKKFVCVDYSFLVLDKLKLVKGDWWSLKDSIS